MARFGILIVVIAALFGAAPAGAQGAEPIGTWLTQAGDAGVRVSKMRRRHLRRDRVVDGGLL